MAVAVLVLAAGRGERLGAPLPKAFVPLAGRTLLERALAAVAVDPVERVVPVIPGEAREPYEALRAAGALKAIPGLAPAVVGGAERQDSMAAGLAALPGEIEWVAVHDAARCLVRGEDVARTIAAARESPAGAALLAAPVRDTIKRVREGTVVETPPRSECWAAQTPQVFGAELLREALAKARAEGFVGTDDAQLVERLGVAVRVVEGSERNLKITRPEDLVLGEAWLREGTGGL